MSTPVPESILGIDIAKVKVDLHLRRTQGSDKPTHRIYDNTAHGHRQVLDRLTTQQVGQLHACLEATSTYGEALALCLRQAGYTVSIVNPLRSKKYGESELSRVKTDQTDAALIARFCLTQRPAAWTPPPAERRHLQDLVAYLGLCPHLSRSGTSVQGPSPLSKHGHASVPKALYFPALVATRFNPAIQALYQRLLARGKPKMVALGAALRKLLHQIYGVLRSREPFDPAHVSTRPVRPAATSTSG